MRAFLFLRLALGLSGCGFLALTVESPQAAPPVWPRLVASARHIRDYPTWVLTAAVPPGASSSPPPRWDVPSWAP